VIVYADASALVKLYIVEPGSNEVFELSSAAMSVATALISRAEVSAALARSVRMRIIDKAGGQVAQRNFARDWPHFARIPLTEVLVARAEALAWQWSLRGYDAVQLASALMWQESVGQEVVLASFDRELWQAGSAAGLEVWPKRIEI
jgi:uncharacterized protein